jgi:UDP-N-acetylglucosamine:LPS N-acetylglucosamine transferase
MRVLVFSASIGEGHDLPARVLAEGITEEEPAAAVEIVDTLALAGPLPRRIVLAGSRFHSTIGSRVFDLIHRLITDVRPTRWLAGKAVDLLAGRPLRRAVARAAPDVVVSTYPGATEALGRLRARGELDVPVVSAITDLAALRFWAHPGVDLHLITHPESAGEVSEIAPRSEVICVRGLTDPRFYAPRDQGGARRDLSLPLDGPIAIVSGGGWAVGDLRGAVEEVLTLPDATVVCLCGRNEALRAELAERFAAEPRVTVQGFTDRMPDLFAAADVLVHSTAGLTVLEAIMRGCGVVSYGWGWGHVRVNNEAFARHHLAEVARSRAELGEALRRSLEAKPAADASFALLPTAASAVLGLADR